MKTAISLLGEYLAKHRADQVTDRLNSVYSVEESRLEPGLGAAQIQALPGEDWESSRGRRARPAGA